MTLRPLPRSRLHQLVPPLVASQALVVLVPVTGDLAWAAATAWEVARAAAQEGRRVALVDLWLDAPLLHESAGLASAEGIVDAFEYGVSLTKAAQQVGDVFFIPAGAATAHPDEILMQPRWRKLQAGFRSEGALLLLFLSATALGKLSAVPDGVLALAPEGFTLEGAGAEGVRAALDRGATLIGTVRERWTPPPESVRPAMEARASGPRILMGRTRRVGAGRAARRPVLVVAGLTVGVAGGWALLARSAEAPAPAVASPHPPAPARPAVVIAAPRADSAAWTVQLAAYGTLPKALAYADRLSRAGVEAFVTPIALDATGAIWYRVLTGGYLTRDSAVAGRAALWRRRLAPRGEGDLLRAPYSFALDGRGDLTHLRSAGVPAVRRVDGRGGAILIGAFETPEQSAIVDAVLKRAGVHATLVTRTGTTP